MKGKVYLWPSDYMADPSVHVWNDRLYIYPSHDWDAGVGDDDSGAEYEMKDYHVFSTDVYAVAGLVVVECHVVGVLVVDESRTDAHALVVGQLAFHRIAVYHLRRECLPLHNDGDIAIRVVVGGAHADLYFVDTPFTQWRHAEFYGILLAPSAFRHVAVAVKHHSALAGGEKQQGRCRQYRLLLSHYCGWSFCLRLLSGLFCWRGAGGLLHKRENH